MARLLQDLCGCFTTASAVRQQGPPSPRLAPSHNSCIKGHKANVVNQVDAHMLVSKACLPARSIHPCSPVHLPAPRLADGQDKSQTCPQAESSNIARQGCATLPSSATLAASAVQLAHCATLCCQVASETPSPLHNGELPHPEKQAAFKFEASAPGAAETGVNAFLAPPPSLALRIRETGSAQCTVMIAADDAGNAARPAASPSSGRAQAAALARAAVPAGAMDTCALPATTTAVHEAAAATVGALHHALPAATASTAVQAALAGIHALPGAGQKPLSSIGQQLARHASPTYSVSAQAALDTGNSDSVLMLRPGTVSRYGRARLEGEEARREAVLAAWHGHLLLQARGIGSGNIVRRYDDDNHHRDNASSGTGGSSAPLSCPLLRGLSASRQSPLPSRTLSHILSQSLADGAAGTENAPKRQVALAGCASPLVPAGTGAATAPALTAAAAAGADDAATANYRLSPAQVSALPTAVHARPRSSMPSLSCRALLSSRPGRSSLVPQYRRNSASASDRADRNADGNTHASAGLPQRCSVRPVARPTGYAALGPSAAMSSARCMYSLSSSLSALSENRPTDFDDTYVLDSVPSFSCGLATAPTLSAPSKGRAPLPPGPVAVQGSSSACSANLATPDAPCGAYATCMAAAATGEADPRATITSASFRGAGQLHTFTPEPARLVREGVGAYLLAAYHGHQTAAKTAMQPASGAMGQGSGSALSHSAQLPGSCARSRPSRLDADAEARVSATRAMQSGGGSRRDVAMQCSAAAPGAGMGGARHSSGNLYGLGSKQSMQHQAPIAGVAVADTCGSLKLHPYGGKQGAGLLPVSAGGMAGSMRCTHSPTLSRWDRLLAKVAREDGLV